MPDPNTAPDASQAASQAAAAQSQVSANAATQDKGNQTPPNGQTPDYSVEDISKVAQFQLSPAERLARLERDYSASSSEARRLKSVNDSFISSLAEQGIKPVFDSKGNLKGYEALEGYEPEANIRLPKFSDLSKSEKELFAEDPEKAIEAYQARVGESVKKALVRAKPTQQPQQKVEAVSPERVEAEINFLAERKLDSGEPRYESFNNKTLAVVKSSVQDFVRNVEGFADFLNKNPSAAVQFVADRIAHSASRWSATAQKSQSQKQQQEQQRNEAANVQSTGSGNTQIAGGKGGEQTQYESGYDNILKRGTLA